MYTLPYFLGGVSNSLSVREWYSIQRGYRRAGHVRVPSRHAPHHKYFFVNGIAFSGATDVLGTSVCRLAMHHITSTFS